MSSRRRKQTVSPETETHFVQMMEWLAMESVAEVARMAERRKRSQSADAEKCGESILDLVISDHASGLGGHTLVTFQKRSEKAVMPWHRLRVGSPVVVSDFPDDQFSLTGVVSRKKRDSLQVALKRFPDGDVFRIDLTVDEAPRRRQLAALQLAKDSRGRLGRLRSIMMGERAPEFSEPPCDIVFRTDLNESQQAAVRFALSAYDLAILHGPPGTGKTTTVVELIVQAIERGDQVLACAPSNTAVDNLLERLIDLKQPVVRIGHPARVTERLRHFSLDGLVAQHENMAIAREMIREAEAIFRKADKWTRKKRAHHERSEQRREARRLLGDARLLERQAVESILDQAKVICATTSFNEEILGDRWFDLAVIDEACQSTEPGCWVPLLRCDKVVMAGDHQQLPPTILSQAAAEQGFAVSLMERQHQQWGAQATQLLTVQYRMHEAIMTFSSDQFYQGELIAHTSVKKHRLCDLEGVAENRWTDAPICFVDTAGAGWEEELEPDGESKRNPNEAEFVLKIVHQWLDSGVPAQAIAVIAPYAAQVRTLRDAAPSRDLEIDTVDGFQGREKEAVIISLVRSNTINEIGFLADTRRMNVALTRARRALVVVGDSATLGGHEFYRQFFEYVESSGAYRTMWEPV